MPKSQALIRAEALIKNQEQALKALEQRMGELMLALATKPAVIPAAIPAAIPAPKRVDDWVPMLHVVEQSASRPVIAVFDCDDEAFKFRAEHAKHVLHKVAVREARAPAGFHVWAVF